MCFIMEDLFLKRKISGLSSEALKIREYYNLPETLKTGTPVMWEEE